MTATLPILKPALDLDPRTFDRALSCVHCGLCLPACPTYVQTGYEADSPRGRIQLMRAMAEGVIEPSDSVLRHLELCLDCRGCETACPSGVVYHELIEETRLRLRDRMRPGFQGRCLRWMFFNVLTHPTRLKLALLPARLLQKIGLYGLLKKTGGMRLLPQGLRKMESMMPPEGRLWPGGLPRVIRARGVLKPKLRVGFFPGCVGSVMFESVNAQAVEVLSACGAEVIIPAEQTCCGAIHHHNGAWGPAMARARANIDAFTGADVITTPIAGCGAMLHEYDHLLRDDPAYAVKARDFARRAKDISVVLMELGLPPLPHRVEKTVTYHDACHLLHAQKVGAAPRKLLAQVSGLKVIPLPESDLCCGAAGTYNLTQPEMSMGLAKRKLANIALTGASACVTGNVGCALQIQSQATELGQPLEVLHPVEVIHRALFGAG